MLKFSDNVVGEKAPDDLNSGIEAPVPSKENKANTVFHALIRWPEVRKAVNKANCTGVTALHAACQRGYAVMVEELLKIESIDINKKDDHDNTPLHSACAGGNIKVITLLIDAGANIQEKNKLEMHPFHVAVDSQKLEVVKMMHTNSEVAKFKKKLLDAKDGDGNTMFLLAVKSGSEAMVEFLLEIGAQIGDTNKTNANVLHLASSIDSLSIIEMIHNRIKNQICNLIKAKDSFSWTPLHYAARRNCIEVVSFLLEK